ncbi:hypothetical protein [Streptomyces sp. ODS28]|uniref:hypothetical protein n=1 Tax=Streptomyces sp. ODS28 TaxID=3136688 RepID=UPI0031E54F4A
MNTRTALHAAVMLAAAAFALAACDAGSGGDQDDAKPEAPASASPAEQELTQRQKDQISKATGLPPKPTGAERQKLLDALAQVAPDVIRYEDKAVSAARNQCQAINGNAKRLDWSASQRFTYKDVVTGEDQGRAINDALRSTGFCKV